MSVIATTTDYHTAGEPFRIVADPPVPIRGATVADRRMFAIDDPEVDHLRKLLCFEPRGHADMYGGFITPPDDSGADFGVLFWHKDTSRRHVGTAPLRSGCGRCTRVGSRSIRPESPTSPSTCRARPIR